MGLSLYLTLSFGLTEIIFRFLFAVSTERQSAFWLDGTKQTKSSSIGSCMYDLCRVNTRLGAHSSVCLLTIIQLKVHSARQRGYASVADLDYLHLTHMQSANVLAVMEIYIQALIQYVQNYTQQYFKQVV